MIFVAVKMDCFHPSATEVLYTSDRSTIKKLGSEWLVYQVRLGQKGILMPFNDETGQHELKAR